MKMIDKVKKASKKYLTDVKGCKLLEEDAEYVDVKKYLDEEMEILTDVPVSIYFDEVHEVMHIVLSVYDDASEEPRYTLPRKIINRIIKESCAKFCEDYIGFTILFDMLVVDLLSSDRAFIKFHIDAFSKEFDDD